MVHVYRHVCRMCLYRTNLRVFWRNRSIANPILFCKEKLWISGKEDRIYIYNFPLFPFPITYMEIIYSSMSLPEDEKGNHQVFPRVMFINHFTIREVEMINDGLFAFYKQLIFSSHGLMTRLSHWLRSISCTSLKSYSKLFSYFHLLSTHSLRNS